MRRKPSIRVEHEARTLQHARGDRSVLVRPFDVVELTIPGGWGQDTSTLARPDTSLQRNMPSIRFRGAEGVIELACFVNPMPVFAPELETFIFERIELAASQVLTHHGDATRSKQDPRSTERTAVRDLGFGRARTVSLGRRMELDAYGFDATGAIHTCFAVCEGAHEICSTAIANVGFQSSIGPRHAPGSAEKLALVAARNPSATVALTLLAIIALSLIVVMFRPRQTNR